MPPKATEKDHLEAEKAARDAVVESIFADLSTARDKAKVLFTTNAPTPEMVFGLYDRLFLVDSDEGDDDYDD